MIKGIFETHINVSDYAKSAQFYEKIARRSAFT
ncbi:hypothetical protein PRIO_2201 [Paenibacillus riograndensis SBR5]|uniref:Uncharacterized protein n=1 Tax=Paenibacillus riograndensis SBR5 TaxID=1073571 RepID=A0A0E4H8L2_9BACL|nr:hypothetical protein PRIO_2201 [Paenibacillus riograndensis SBR5]